MIGLDEMRLREGCEPQLAWKFSDGRGSKEWITLHDEDSYKRMIQAGAKRIRDRAKKESNLKDADLSHGWRIDIKVRNKVQRIEEEADDEDMTVPAEGKEREKTKKKRKRSKKVTAKKKRGGQKKAFPCSDHNCIATETRVLSLERRLSLRFWCQTLMLERQMH